MNPFINAVFIYDSYELKKNIFTCQLTIDHRAKDERFCQEGVHSFTITVIICVEWIMIRSTPPLIK